MTSQIKLLLVGLTCTLALAIGIELVQAECADEYCETTEHRVIGTNSKPCSTEDNPCYGQTVETWAQKCSPGATGKQCTLYSGISSKTTKRDCVEGVCVVTQVTSTPGTNNRCITTDCPAETGDEEPAPLEG